MALTFEEVLARPNVLLAVEQHFRKKFVLQLRQQHYQARQRLERAERELATLKESRTHTPTNTNTPSSSGRMAIRRRARTEDDRPQPTRRLTEQQIENVFNRIRGRRF